MIKKFIAFHAFLLQLFIPGIAQNVGIGNVNPSFPLDVSGQLRIRSTNGVSTAGIYFNKIDNSTTQAYVGMQSDSYVGFFGVPLNAWGMLMNTTTGNVGIGNINPQYLLDISGRMRIRSQDGVNTAGIYFNKIDNSNTQAFIGMQSDNYVGLFGVPLNNWGLLMNTSNGNVGLGNNTSPQALLHIVRGQRTNGPLVSSAAAVIEGDQGGWLQLSNNNNIEGGILSGNQVTAIRSAVIFGTDSSLLLRSGGNFTRLTLTKTGEANFSQGITVSGEVKRPSTGSANLVPICYGSVNLIGEVQSGTGNFSVEWTGSGNYHITIPGEDYNVSDYCVFISPVGIDDQRSFTLRTVFDTEYIYLRIYNSAGTSTATAFNFIVYKP